MAIKLSEARKWAHWWNVRGYNATLKSHGWKKFFECYLSLKGV